MRWVEVTWWEDLIHCTAERPDQLYLAVSWPVDLVDSETPTLGGVSATQNNFFPVLDAFTARAHRELVTLISFSAI